MWMWLVFYILNLYWLYWAYYFGLFNQFRVFLHSSLQTYQTLGLHISRALGTRHQIVACCSDRSRHISLFSHSPSLWELVVVWQSLDLCNRKTLAEVTQNHWRPGWSILEVVLYFGLLIIKCLTANCLVAIQFRVCRVQILSF